MTIKYCIISIFRIEDLLVENQELLNEIKQLRSKKGKPIQNYESLQKAINNLEKSVLTERRSHHRLVEKLRREKVNLIKEIEKFRINEKELKMRVEQLINQNRW